MIDFSILTEAGTTNERFRDVLTAVPYSHVQIQRLTKKHGPAEAKKMVKRRDKDCETRKKIQDLCMSRVQEHVIFALANHHFYSAVDVAWDSTPINKHIVPLMMYAQGRLDLAQCATSLSSLQNGNQYIRKNESGAVVGIDLPKFTEMNINLVRSIITRRHAAQDNKYAGMYPWFKFESRTTGEVGKLRADAISQIADEVCDNYGWRDTQEQVERDIMLYTTVAAFPTAPWEREVQWVRKGVAEEFKTDEKAKIPKTAKVVKEGFGWTLPHPSRVFHDNNYPIWTLNTDSGCEYVGFWDVERYGDVVDNPVYFNRENISYTSTYAWLIGNDAYFNQYFDALKPPPSVSNDRGSLSDSNDRKNNVGVYTGEMKESSVFTAHYYWKMKPLDWGIGDYPYPIWVHLKLAGDCTAVFAEIMPSSPCAVARFNASDNRLLNNSIAHDLIGLQDQLTNLYSRLLAAIQEDQFAMGVLNVDIFPNTEEGKKLREQFKTILQGKNFYAQLQVLEASFEKMRDMGIPVTAENLFTIKRMPPNSTISEIFNAIASVVQMAEKLSSLSPQEQGQPAPREISATESQLIAGTTNSVYSFISKPIDGFRAAQKRIFFESYMALGSDEKVVPVVRRYTKETIERAGFKILDDDAGVTALNEFTVQVKKGDLQHSYVFTTRDGENRTSDSKSAEILTKLLQGIGQAQPPISSAIFAALKKSGLYKILNSIMRNSGAGEDIILELAPGEEDELNATEDEQLMGQLAKLAELVQRDAQDIGLLKQQVQQILSLVGGGQPRISAPPPPPAPLPAPMPMMGTATMTG